MSLLVLFPNNSALSYTLTCVVSTFILSGSSTNTIKAVKTQVTSASYVETGVNVNTLYNKKTAISAGVFTETGQSNNLVKAKRIVNSVGIFNETGISSNLLFNRKFSANVGSFILTGNQTTLIYIPISGYTLIGNSGTFGLTGNSLNLLTQRKSQLSASNYSLSLIDGILKTARKIETFPGVLYLDGMNDNLIRSYHLYNTPQTFSLIGISSNFIYPKILNVDTSNFELYTDNSNLYYREIKKKIKKWNGKDWLIIINS